MNMKKLIYSMFALAIMAMTFNSCEDVPAPYALPGDDDPVVIEPTGDGTLDNPFNVAAALAFVENLASDEETTQDFYIKGKVSAITTNYDQSEPQFGNAVFYISDDGTTAKQFYVYRALYLGNKKYTSGTTLQNGDEVIICGKLVNYRGTTPETVQNKSFLYSLNGVTEGGGETPAAIEINCAQAVELTTALADNATSTEVYAVTGYITEVVGSVSRNQQTFWMADTKDGQNTFEAYYADLPDGVSEFKKGMKVKITGNLQKYVNNSGAMTPEIKNAKVEILENAGGDDEGGDDEGGETTYPTSGDNGNFESWADGVPTNWKTASTAGNAKLAQSTEAHGGSYSVKVSGDTGANKRIGYKELSLKKGNYSVVFYAKALAEGGSLNPGFVPIKADGSAGTYKYSGYVDNVSTSEWQKVEATLEIPSDGVYCIVVMNQKKSSAVDIFIDDFTVTLGSTTIIK